MVDETDVSDREKESSDSDSDGKTQVVVKKNTLHRDLRHQEQQVQRVNRVFRIGHV